MGTQAGIRRWPRSLGPSCLTPSTMAGFGSAAGCGWAYLQVGAPGTFVIRAHARLPVSLTGVRVGCGPPRTRWLTSVVPAPGRVDGG